MKLLSLTKIGNLKLGVIKDGRPIQTSRILVTRATKEGGENFKILEGFNPQGEASVNVTLPFDDIELNFELNYIGFLTIDGKEYISKSKDIGEDLILYPLNVEDFELEVINAGKLTEVKIKEYNMEKTGFLKCMLDKISGFGEVFYFKTKSINTIRSISDQLQLLSALTDNKLAGIPLKLTPVKKDINDKQVVYLSISFPEDIIFDLNRYVTARKEESLNFKAYETLYKDSREVKDAVKIKDIKDTKEFKVEKDLEQEISEIKEETASKKETDMEEKVKELIRDKEIDFPIGTVVAVYNTLGEDGFIEFFDKEVTLQDCFRIIQENSK